MGLYRHLIRPLLFRFDAERIHDITLRGAGLAGRAPGLRPLAARLCTFANPSLQTSLGGIPFQNPIGLAAGYDKNGRAIDWMAALGFGFLEIGSVSADPSDGNPKPRLFRLPLDRAIVVNYGLPNEGADAIAQRLAPMRRPVPLGINIVKTNRLRPEPPDAIFEDYVRSVKLLKDAADYLVLNLSCPNTETGREFFSTKEDIAHLLGLLREIDIRVPLFLKISPLGIPERLETTLEAVDPFPFLTGFIFNLPPGKVVPLVTPAAQTDRMPGSVAGKPVEPLINKAIGELYRRMDRDRYSIIGVGGVFDAEDAYRKIRLGASLVQILTALVYEGPAVVRNINRGLCELLTRDGFSSIAEAVGVDSV